VTPVANQPTATQLTLLDSVIAAVARLHHLKWQDRDDFAQSVHLRLAERHYDIFVRFAGRSSLRTFLTVVVSRLLSDWRNGQCGKWRPSAAARRRGPWAMALERLVFRDGYSPNEAIRHLSQGRDAPTADAMTALFAELPARQRRTFSLVEDLPDWRVEDLVEVEERRRRRRVASVAVARALRALPADDRRVIGLRYVHGQSLRSIAEASKVDPKLLYRRVERVMRSLRTSVQDGCAA
jgi:RNA polymerase sigma factor (sigma-70 family)